MLDKHWDNILLLLGIIKFGFLLYFPYPNKKERLQKFQLNLLRFLIQEKLKEVKKPFTIYEWSLDNYFYNLKGKFLKKNKFISPDKFKKLILKDFSLKESDFYVRAGKNESEREILIAKEYINNHAAQL